MHYIPVIFPCSLLGLEQDVYCKDLSSALFAVDLTRHQVAVHYLKDSCLSFGKCYHSLYHRCCFSPLLRMWAVVLVWLDHDHYETFSFGSCLQTSFSADHVLPGLISGVFFWYFYRVPALLKEGYVSPWMNKKQPSHLVMKNTAVSVISYNPVRVTACGVLNHTSDSELERQILTYWWISLTRSSLNVMKLISFGLHLVSGYLPDHLQIPIFVHAVLHAPLTICSPRLLYIHIRTVFEILM